jgi:hypothetical protein
VDIEGFGRIALSEGSQALRERERRKATRAPRESELRVD